MNWRESRIKQVFLAPIGLLLSLGGGGGGGARTAVLDHGSFVVWLLPTSCIRTWRVGFMNVPVSKVGRSAGVGSGGADNHAIICNMRSEPNAAPFKKNVFHSRSAMLSQPQQCIREAEFIWPILIGHVKQLLIPLRRESIGENYTQSLTFLGPYVLGRDLDLSVVQGKELEGHSDS
ncbi:uncharacterized protein FOMMEDRAFT_151116 [Fomitiporia mediterranea MF3/22]|uniref:uncharacterized protein n=1 Tax=Fomitiporia mediterranea (strain MF3/22) TaxID=694068 RepID=UPI00044073C4|nr:uncharacterized protein FOMMEDRAFT_151116 [Fomitiporia mediterranea MF3/22]EJD08337.1 hypothetical protein FOMMEDRAFT_151116 [Fomitiporia mediterranea MF3/22]